jgi:dolichyl-diphosphooligosaccharide--protein glycosyltransferase
MTDVREETAALLDDDSELADALRTLVEIDHKQEEWTFDDIPLGSGTFGELVARGIVVETGAGYRLADRHAVRVALGDVEPTDDDTAGRFRAHISRPDVPRHVLAAITACLLVVVAFRVFVYPRVFRGEHVVLLGNDPYYYRYLVLSMLDAGAGALDVPASITTGEPLLVALLTAAARAFGGSPHAAERVLAWYPVVVALATGILCYWLAVTLSRDRRVGLTSVLVLAVLPVHGYRTALGFADHHALDFLWLAVVALAAVRTLPARGPHASTSGWRSRLPWAAVLAVGIAAQAHSWNAAPLLFVPFVAYAVVRSGTLARSDEPLHADALLVAGVGAGGLLAVAGHVVLGWQSTNIVVPPVLAAVAMAFAVGTAALARRLDWPAWTASALAVASGVLTLGVVVTVEPSFGAELAEEGRRLVGMSGSDIVETKSLFSSDYGLFVGPIFFYGTALLFALPAGAWAFSYGLDRARWLLTASYGLVLFVLAVTQVRFTGELALFVAVFAGFAFVYFLDVVDITDPPEVFAARDPREQTPSVRSFAVPERRTLLSLGFAFLLVGGLGIMMTPARTNTIVPSEDTYRAAAWMEERVESPDWTSDQEYVFSTWSQNRLYNAFVSGNSQSYGYARSNYESFLASTNASTWYERLRGRAAFVVADDDFASENATELLATRLADWGSETGHYRAVWRGSSKTVYTLVPGATITGVADANATVTVTHEGTVSGTPFTYERTTTAAPNGSYAIRVPYAGEYDVAGTTVNVPEQAIRNGTQINTSAS